MGAVVGWCEAVRYQVAAVQLKGDVGDETRFKVAEHQSQGLGGRSGMCLRSDGWFVRSSTSDAANGEYVLRT